MTAVHRFTFTRATGVACMLALGLAAGAVLAADPSPAERPAPTKEMREKMASAHEQMAACLKSDRPIADCHSEMMKNHEEMMMHHEAGEHDGMAMGDCMHKRHHEHAKPEQAPSDSASK